MGTSVDFLLHSTAARVHSCAGGRSSSAVAFWAKTSGDHGGAACAGSLLMDAGDGRPDAQERGVGRSDNDKVRFLLVALSSPGRG